MNMNHQEPVFYRDVDAKLKEIFSKHCNLSGEQYQEIQKRLIYMVATIQDGYPIGDTEQDAEELGVIFDQIGTPTYARDLAVAIFTAIEQGVKPGIYHFSNEGVISWYDFTKAIHRLAGITTCHVNPLHTSEYPTPAARPHYSVLDKTKIKQTYGVEIPYWEESLKECIDELLK